jgi:hypothetical protein
VAHLRKLLRDILSDTDEVLAWVQPEVLLENRRIQVYDVTVMEAIYGVSAHFAMHAGQILYATKLITGEDLGFTGIWKRPTAEARLPGEMKATETWKAAGRPSRPERRESYSDTPRCRADRNPESLWR